MIYDEAARHVEALPSDLSRSAAATHIGHFLTWVIARGLISERHLTEHAEDLDKVKRGWWSGRDYLQHCCNERLTSEDLNAAGRAFAAAYYASGKYLQDFRAKIAEGRPSIYHVRDTQDVVESVHALLDQRMAQWGARPAPARSIEVPEPPPPPTPVVERAPPADLGSLKSEAFAETPHKGSPTQGIAPARKNQWRRLKAQWRTLSGPEDRSGEAQGRTRGRKSSGALSKGGIAGYAILLLILFLARSCNG